MGLQDRVLDVELEASSLSDAAGTAEAALSEAVSFAGQKMGLGRAQVVIALKQNDHETQGYFQYGLARQIAGQMAALDANVKAVYMYEDEATAEDEALGDCRASTMLHLIVRAQRKTGALTSLVVALDRALVEGYASLASLPNLAHMLDVQVVDDQDIRKRTGYGALLSSLHHKPLPVWEK